MSEDDILDKYAVVEKKKLEKLLDEQGKKLIDKSISGTARIFNLGVHNFYKDFCRLSMDERTNIQIYQLLKKHVYWLEEELKEAD